VITCVHVAFAVVSEERFVPRGEVTVAQREVELAEGCSSNSALAARDSSRSSRIGRGSRFSGKRSPSRASCYGCSFSGLRF